MNYQVVFKANFLIKQIDCNTALTIASQPRCVGQRLPNAAMRRLCIILQTHLLTIPGMREDCQHNYNQSHTTALLFHPRDT